MPGEGVGNKKEVGKLVQGLKIENDKETEQIEGLVKGTGELEGVQEKIENLAFRNIGTVQ